MGKQLSRTGSKGACAAVPKQPFLLYIKRRDMEETGVQLRVLEAEVVSRKLYLVDDRYGVIFWPDEMGNGFALSGQVVENAWLARKYLREFEPARNEAVPGGLVVDISGDNLAVGMRVQVVSDPSGGSDTFWCVVTILGA